MSCYLSIYNYNYFKSPIIIYRFHSQYSLFFYHGYIINSLIIILHKAFSLNFNLNLAIIIYIIKYLNINGLFFILILYIFVKKSIIYNIYYQFYFLYLHILLFKIYL